MNNNNSNNGLMRYGSAPESLLKAAVDSVMNEYSTAAHQFAPTSRFFPESTTTTTTTTTTTSDCNINMRPNLNENAAANTTTSAGIGLQRSYGFPTTGNGNGNGNGSSSSLVRHSSSPAGFLNQLAAAASASASATDINGFSITNAIGSYNNPKVDNGRGISRLNSQLSFTRKEALSRIAEENEDGSDGFITTHNNNNNNDQRKNSNNTHSYGFGIGSWDDQTNNPVMFSMASSKRSKSSDVDHALESQFEFSMAQTLEMDAMDKLLHNIPQDSVPCKIRAKRGCATHPRSIAERERRTRISGKLKKLQDLVPNMDKQTSYSDMLDLAVQHIKTLQNQVQKLNKEVDSCTCGCSKNNTDSQHKN